MKKYFYIFVCLNILVSSCAKVEDKIYNIDENTSYVEDVATLSELFAEIVSMSKSKICKNANDWHFVAYGSKACGGCVGFIAYSEKIDVDEFFDKVETHKILEKVFNIKHGVISDCGIPPEPTAVTCVNEEANLVY